MSRDSLLPRGTETILVIDDDPGIMGMVTDFLSSLGYQVLEAGDLPAALAVARDSGDSIDLAIADVVLGDTNGVEVARRLRERRADLPVVFMSGITDGMEGATPNTFFVKKPFTLEALAAVTRHALDHGRI